MGTLGVGMLGVLLTLSLLQTPFTLALERMLAQFQWPTARAGCRGNPH